jgi:hypothetical protein
MDAVATEKDLAQALRRIPPPLCESRTMACLKSAKGNALLNR